MLPFQLELKVFFFFFLSNVLVVYYYYLCVCKITPLDYLNKRIKGNKLIYKL